MLEKPVTCRGVLPITRLTTVPVRSEQEIRPEKKLKSGFRPMVRRYDPERNKFPQMVWLCSPERIKVPMRIWLGNPERNKFPQMVWLGNPKGKSSDAEMAIQSGRKKFRSGRLCSPERKKFRLQIWL